MMLCCRFLVGLALCKWCQCGVLIWSLSGQRPYISVYCDFDCCAWRNSTCYLFTVEGVVIYQVMTPLVYFDLISTVARPAFSGRVLRSLGMDSFLMSLAVCTVPSLSSSSCRRRCRCQSWSHPTHPTSEGHAKLRPFFRSIVFQLLAIRASISKCVFQGEGIQD